MCISCIVDIFIHELCIRFKEEWTSETLFWIWNINGFAGNGGPLIFIPLALSVPTDSKNSSRIGFYVHKPPILVPRSIGQALSKQIFVQQYAGEPAQLNKNKKKGNCDLQKEILLQESNRDNALLKKKNCHWLRHKARKSFRWFQIWAKKMFFPTFCIEKVTNLIEWWGEGKNSYMCVIRIKMLKHTNLNPPIWNEI